MSSVYWIMGAELRKEEKLESQQERVANRHPPPKKKVTEKVLMKELLQKYEQG